MRARAVFMVGVLSIGGGARADVIGELVAEVSETRIRDDIAALEFPRWRHESWARAVSHVFLELDAAGYDVTFELVEQTQNVIARRAGTKTPERVFVLGAHLDTVPGSPGADDNASGVAAVLEIARVLRDYEPESSIEFVAFALEEIGLVGSRQYAQRMAGKGVEVIGMISLDMIGYTCDVSGCQQPFDDIPACLDLEPEGADVGTFVLGLGNDDSAGIMDHFREAAQRYVPALEVVTMQVAGRGLCFGDSRRSDHAPFWDEGYRAMVFTDTANFRNPHYHRSSDRLETLDLAFARRVTQATLATVLLETGARPCPADVDGSGVVDFDDVLAVLGAWGPYGACPPYRREDVDRDCDITFADLLIVLGGWGECE